MVPRSTSIQMASSMWKVRVWSRHMWARWLVFEESPDSSCDEAFEASGGFSFGLAFAGSSSHVVLGDRAAALAGDSNEVEGPVELTITTAVEPVAVSLFGGFEHELENNDDDELPELRSSMPDGMYQRAVDVAKEYILEGDIFQVVLAQRYDIELGADPSRIERWLALDVPDPIGTVLLGAGSFPGFSTAFALAQIARAEEVDDDDRYGSVEVCEVDLAVRITPLSGGGSGIGEAVIVLPEPADGEPGAADGPGGEVRSQVSHRPGRAPAPVRPPAPRHWAVPETRSTASGPGSRRGSPAVPGGPRPRGAAPVRPSTKDRRPRRPCDRPGAVR